MPNVAAPVGATMTAVAAQVAAVAPVGSGQAQPLAGKPVIAAGTGGATLTAAAPDSAWNSLLQGRIKLDQAVESQDANAIKGALAKLFKLYEDQVEQLQAAK